MVLRKAIFILGLVILSSCSQGDIKTVKDKSDPISDEVNLKVDGELLYMNQCVSCHGPKGDLGNSGSKDLTKSKLNEAAILKIIKEGKGTMPPFEYLLTTEKERQAVAQYVMSMRKEEK